MNDDCLKRRKGENLVMRLEDTIFTLSCWTEHAEILLQRLSEDEDRFWQDCEYFVCKVEKMREAVK